MPPDAYDLPSAPFKVGEGYLPLLRGVRLLRDEVMKLVLEAIAQKSFDPPEGRANSPCLPRIKSQEKVYQLPQDLRALFSHWLNLFAWRIPWKGTPERQEIDEIFFELGKVVCFERQFKSRRTAYQEVFDLYILPFHKLEQWAQHLARYGMNAIDRFQREHEQKLSELKIDFDKNTPVFLSINYGQEGKQVPPEVDETLRRQLQKDYGVILLLAKDYRESRNLEENTLLLMHACTAGMAFFTKSNVQQRGAQHNPNVCFEIGYLTALGKPVGLFFHKDSRLKIEDFALIRGLLNYSYRDPQSARKQMVEFLEKELRIPRVRKQMFGTRRKKS